MKQIFYIAALITLLFVVEGLAQKKGESEREIESQRYDSYFEKNNSNLKGNTSYLVITTQNQFDKVFGVAATMGQNNFLPDEFFNSKLVVAAIKRGDSIQTYELERVIEKKGKLYLSYKTKKKEAKGAFYSSPFIIAVDKGNYSQVVFIENGKKVKAVSLSKNK